MTQSTPAAPLMVVAGSTGDLCHRIARQLKQRGGIVRALVRPTSTPKVVAELRGLGVDVQKVDYADPAALRLVLTHILVKSAGR